MAPEISDVSEISRPLGSLASAPRPEVTGTWPEEGLSARPDGHERGRGASFLMLRGCDRPRRIDADRATTRRE
jgi:hypothetical protein